jgi:hypothetical protein
MGIGMVKEMQIEEDRRLIALELSCFFGRSVNAGMKWLKTDNPYLGNKSPQLLSLDGNTGQVLAYIKENMDPKVRQRCIKYATVRTAQDRTEKMR